MGIEHRSQPRLPITLKVEYQTAGAFLMAYSINLSKGGIFIETSTPLAIGDTLSLSFDVPGAGSLAVEGTVTWVRKDSSDGLPAGMGIQFRTLDERYGDTIDKLVRNFVGLRVMVSAASADRLSLIARYIRSIITCEIAEATTPQAANEVLKDRPDLAVIDLDIRSALSMDTVRACRALEPPVPIISLAGKPELRTEAKDAGADEVLATPPSYHDLQAAVIRTLSRPAAIK